MTRLRSIAGCIVLVLIVGTVGIPLASSHTQETMNVILIENESRPGNITDPSFVQGNALMFRMKDNTNDSSMMVRIDVDRNGVFNDTLDNQSSWLTATCELDENGSLADENCSVSYTFQFLNLSVGAYSYQVLKAVNETVTDTWNYTILLHEDVHEEPGLPSVGDCFGSGCEQENNGELDQNEGVLSTETILKSVMILAGIGSVMLILSILGDRAAAPSTTEEE